MQNRIFAGSARALTLVAIASLILLPALDSNAAVAGKNPANGLTAPTSSGGSAVASDSIEPMTLYPRVNYTWQYATGPVYGELEGTNLSGPGVVRLDVGSFDLRRGTPAIPAELQATPKFERAGGQYFILAFDPAAAKDGGFDRIRETVVTHGGAIVQELGTSSYVVRIDAAAYEALMGSTGVAALEFYQPAFKLNPRIGRAPLEDPVQALSDVYNLDVRLFPGEDPNAVAQAIRSLGGNVIETAPDAIRVEIHRDRLAALAGIDGVSKVLEHLTIHTFGAETTATMQTGRWNSGQLPYHDAFINGGGARGTCSVATTTRCQGAGDCPGVETCNGAGSPQVLMMIDSGIQLDGGDLSDTRINAGAAGAAHRKVKKYTTTAVFGGSGDLKGCDDPAQNGLTHGHVVASTALGNATRVPVRYGAGWTKLDQNNIAWPIDGVAPRAILAIYDGQSTPLLGSCTDPLLGGLTVGTIYSGTGTGGLEIGFNTDGARTFNFSWGTTNNPAYGVQAARVDAFLSDPAYAAAMIFIAAGNDGRDANSDQVPDPGSISDPATAKNAVVVGGSGNTSEPFNDTNEQDRWVNSGVGPATTVSQRVAPILMAPAIDFGATGGNMGFDGENACRSSDNLQDNPVECDVVQGPTGTSFSAPGAAGSAMLIRDYFAQGFYPDGSSSNTTNSADIVTALSGALVKAALIASADWMDDSNPRLPPTNFHGDTLNANYRFNNEQGYGRIQLNNVLPLQSYSPSPSGLLIADGVIAGGKLNIPGLTGDINTSGAEIDTGTFNVCDDTKELRIALTWLDTNASESLARNLDLEVRAPSGKIYYGNYFTDDNNRDGAVAGSEDCPNSHITGSITTLDESPWSLETCGSSVRDSVNPTEAVLISPDARVNTMGGGFNGDKQTEAGLWRVLVRTGSPSAAATVAYAVVVTGGTCNGAGSYVQLDRGSYVCNQAVSMNVTESDDVTDPAVGLNDTAIAARASIEVVASDGTVFDTESSLTFTHVGGTLRFTSNPILISDSTVAVPNNGTLDVRSGQVLRAVYADRSGGVADAAKRRIGISNVSCNPKVQGGGVTFNQFGINTTQLVDGGCERDARNYFTFGFPDRYMDAGENVTFRIAFQSSETETLTDALASLRCVLVDGDSPADCQPGTTQCADPNRLNNTACGALMDIKNSPIVIGPLPPGQIATPAFTIQMGTFSGVQKVEMLVGVSAKKSGRTVETLIVSRNSLNSDELSYFYSTDFPTGGVEIRDYALGDVGNQPSNEAIDMPSIRPGDFSADYRFDSITWSSLQATLRNTLISPWNFDTSNNFFTVGLNNTTTTPLAETIANWGEDKNFNDQLDWFCSLSTTTSCPGAFPAAGCGRCNNNTNIICSGSTAVCSGNPCVVDAGLGTCVSNEDRLPQNGALDNNWGTAGGCGWQTSATNAPGTPGGVWHTGQISTAGAAPCLFIPGGSGACAQYGTIVGTQNIKREWEMLLTPEFEKVNQCNTDLGSLPLSCNGVFDTATEKVFEVEFMDWAWNMALDLKDRWANVRWEFDTDTTTIAPVDLFNDAVVLNAFSGNQGPISDGNAPLLDGFPVFAPLVGASSLNGTVGLNRNGRNPCFFEVNPRPVPIFHMADPMDDDCNNDAASPFGETSNESGLPVPGNPNNCCDGLDNDADGLTDRLDPGCTFAADPTTDEYVLPNGPIRNFNMQQVNGPDMRFSTFEDIYGPSGASFQGAVGFRVFEGNTTTGDAQTSFGASVDDMVVQWREYTLIEDASDCSSSGTCATVEASSSNTFDGQGQLTVTVTDTSPYGRAVGDKKNDCNYDGDFIDGTDDNDCDDNGIEDVTVRVLATTGADTNPGERLTLNKVGSNPIYVGSIPISATANVNGVLFIVDGGPNNSEALVRYNDRWDGVSSGLENPCQPDADPANWGLVSQNVNVITIPGNVTVESFRISDGSGTGTPPLPGGQDGDGYPDTGETVDMFITISNKTDEILTNVVAQLASADPKIDCLLKSSIFVASIPAHSSAATVEAFRFKVHSSADRSGAVPAVACNSGVCSNGAAGTCGSAANCMKTTNDDYSATFSVTLSATQFDINAKPQSIVADLDLNSRNAVQTTGTFSDGFEGGFGVFVLSNLDENLGTNALSNGKRCQYNDPDFVNSNSFGDTECYLGFRTGQTIANDWQIYDTSQPDGGRAYLGSNSLWYGISTPGNPGLSTYGLSQMDAVRTKNPINLAARVCANDGAANKRSCNQTSECTVGGGCATCTGTALCVSANPELSFKHQVSTTDNRSTNTPAGQAADRAIVQVQLNAAGAVYSKVTPYANVYDAQGTDNFSNCTFDPDDDGNNEDSYFDPSDPDRRLGPSSTCFPEFAFSFVGDTVSYGAGNMGRGSDPPGLQGSLGVGTWAESKFDMSRYRGRAIRFRFLLTSIKVSDQPTLEALFMWNPNRGDDGWFIDDVKLTGTNTTTPTVSQDTIDNSGLPSCGVACNTLTVGLGASPSATTAPNLPVVLTATPNADRCVNGVILYQFFIDGDANGVYNSPGDTLLQDFTTNPRDDEAPAATTTYTVVAKCSSASGGSCAGASSTTTVTVGCPNTPLAYNASTAGAWWNNVTFGANKTTISWPAANQVVDLAKGSLSVLRSSPPLGNYGVASQSCLLNNSSALSFTDAALPATGDGFYYLMRGQDDYCNENKKYTTYHPKETPTAVDRRDDPTNGVLICPN